MGKISIFLLIGMLISGCALRTFPEEAAEFPYAPAEPPREGSIFHLATGFPLDKEALFDILADYRVVYVGESHDSMEDHRVQAEIVRGLARRMPGRIAVGMEMFTRSAQDSLDRWHEGKVSEKEFEKLWDESWSVDIEYYRPVLDAIRENGLPVIGLKAPKEVDRDFSSRFRPDSPPPSGEGIPELGPPDPYQTEFLKAIFAGHGQGSGPAGMSERFAAVQTLWDESMAETAYEYLKSDIGKDKKIIILAGGHHVNYGFGIPRRLFRRMPVSYAIVRPEVLSTENIPEEHLMDVDIPVLPLRPADFLWYVAYHEPEIKPKRLGVVVTAVEGGAGLKVMAVHPGSAAEAAGIRTGDVLLDLDEKKLSEPFDLRYLLKRAAEGDEVRIHYLRDGLPMEALAEIGTEKKAGRAGDK